MNHDHKRAPADMPYRPAGSGMLMARLCDTCRQPKSLAGGKVIRLMWCCAECLANRLSKRANAKREAA